MLFNRLRNSREYTPENKLYTQYDFISSSRVQINYSIIQELPPSARATGYVSGVPVAEPKRQRSSPVILLSSAVKGHLTSDKRESSSIHSMSVSHNYHSYIPRKYHCSHGQYRSSPYTDKNDTTNSVLISGKCSDFLAVWPCSYGILCGIASFNGIEEFPVNNLDIIFSKMTI